MLDEVVADAAPAGHQHVLVTGGAGFVGRACVAAFRARGATVTVVDREPFPDDGNDGGSDDSGNGDIDRTGAAVHSIVGELTDPDVLDAAVGSDVDGVVHLAAATSVLGSLDRPGATFDANVGVTQRLLELARRRGVERFLLASTNAVTGDVGTRTIREDLPLRPLTPYGATKAACEMLLSGYTGAYGIAGCALRFTNIYGPGMEHKDSFVPRLMRAAANGTGVQVYGDGTQRRDLVHVSDVVQAILSAWQRKHHGTVIVGSGRSGTVLELVDAARTATGRPIPVTHVPPKAGEMPAVIVDIGHARDVLGYEPAMALTDGLATVWPEFAASATPGGRPC